MMAKLRTSLCMYMALAASLVVLCTEISGQTTPPMMVPPLLSTPRPLITNCNDSALDLVFVLDSSGSVGQDNFITMKTFVKSIVQNLNIGPDQTRIGLITFSKYPFIRFGLGDYRDKDGILRAIDNVPYIAGITETQSALYMLQNEGFLLSRHNVPHVAIVITDGKSFHTNDTMAAAASAQAQGIVMFSIGIGGDINIQELNSIATDPDTEHVFTVTNFASLMTISNSLTSRTCEVKSDQNSINASTTAPSGLLTPRPAILNATDNGTNEACNRTVADIVFVLDSSGSLGLINFEAVKQFVINVVNYLDIGPAYTEVAVITFSNYPTIRLNLTSYTDKFQLINAINQIPYYPGNTETDKALDLLRLEGFKEGRKNAPNIAIVVTDGLSTNPDLTKIAASELKKNGVTTFAIGIGSDIESHELSAISSDPDSNYVFFAANFSDLSKIEDSLAKTTCLVQFIPTTIQTGPPTPPIPSTTIMHTPSTRKPATTQSPATESTTQAPPSSTPSCLARVADVVFVVDSSGSVGEDNFLKIKDFMKQTIKVFDIGTDYTRVGVITFSTAAALQFTLGQYNTSASLMNAIDNIGYAQGGTNTAAALELLRLQGFSGGRPFDPNIAIVITDGYSKDKFATKQQALLAKTGANITIIAIGIGNGTDVTELTDIATVDSSTGQSLVYQVGDFEALQTLQHVVATVACGFVVARPTAIASTMLATPTTKSPGSNCTDTIPNCEEYGNDICNDYRPWATAHCSRHCRFCEGPVTTPTPCMNTIDNCPEYGSYICTSVTFILWAKRNCAKYCGFCGGGPLPTEPTTPMITTPKNNGVCENTISNCEEYGGPSVCQNPVYESWARAHCAEYCTFCSKYVHYKGQTLSNNVTCPDWNLPYECKLVNTNGSCCPMPQCPSGYTLTAKSPLEL